MKVWIRNGETEVCLIVWIGNEGTGIVYSSVDKKRGDRKLV